MSSLVKQLTEVDGDSVAERSRLMQRISIGRFLLAGGTDAPIAVELMLRKTPDAMRSGLVLLGVGVRSLDYVPTKTLKVNGLEVHLLVNRLVKAALQSSAHFEHAPNFSELSEELRRAVDDHRLSDGQRGAPLRSEL